MQPMKLLITWLTEHANSNRGIYSFKDMRALYPELSDIAFKTLLSRSVSSGHLIKVCRGIYLSKYSTPDGLTLFHTASMLRANDFNYISLETALSDAGIISQIPLNTITIMSSGRSNIIDCGQFGKIEFIHTTQKPDQIMNQLQYDDNCGLWRANVALALRDMRATHRSIDLLDKDTLNEFI